MKNLIHLSSGALFGLGLVVSGMIDPAKVIGFLDVAGGSWDPTLAFVMGGALIPMVVAWRVAARMSAPVSGGRFPGAPVGGIDRRLVAGAAMFGAGWGLVGFCPGPALAALGVGGWRPAAFVAAMILGMVAERAFSNCVAGRLSRT